MKRKKIKILIVSLNPWDDNNSFGSSFSNIFGGEDCYEIANIYCESGAPNTVVCKYFFQITLKNIIKSIFNSEVSSGVEVSQVSQNGFNDLDRLSVKERNVLNIAKKLRWQILFWARDFVWSRAKWRSRELDLFITDFAPDIIFQPIFYSSYVNEIGIHAKKITNKPMIGYISDDNYTYKQFSLSPLFWIDRSIKRGYVKRVIDNCKILYTITERQKIEYNDIFGNKCKLLFKGGAFADFSHKKEHLNTPLKIVYTGNLGSGRWESLASLADSLIRVNKDGVKAQLFIYSMTLISNSIMKRLDVNGTSYFCGGLPSSEIKDIQRDADILVHVESFRLSERYSARLSFSTKIVDYLEAGRCILAIGWDKSGAIEYLKEHNAAVVISDEKELLDRVFELINNPELIHRYAELGFNCGAKNHQIDEIRANLYKDIIVHCDHKSQ